MKAIELKNVLQCPYCGTLQYGAQAARGERVACCRCDSTIDRHYNDSINKTLALSVAALMLFFPANIFPVITFELWGDVRQSTIWSSIVSLYESDMPFIATVVLAASIIVPVVKISAMIGLCLGMKRGVTPHTRTVIFKLIERTGHWSMLDIFLVAVLIAVIKLGDLAYAAPGPGLIYFAAMVICTMLASASFDPKMIWESNNEEA